MFLGFLAISLLLLIITMIWMNLAQEEIQIANMKGEEEENNLLGDNCDDVETGSDNIGKNRLCCLQIARVLIKTENVRKYFLRPAEKIVRNIFCVWEDFIRLE